MVEMNLKMTMIGFFLVHPLEDFKIRLKFFLLRS